MQKDKVFDGSIPDVYDTCLVPLIFEHYADDLAARVAALAPGDVLETAAGSGVVTRALAQRLAPDARFTVTDLNPPMLERCRARQPADDRIDWQAADALDLPFEQDSFDTVLCQFGVMFFPDKIAGYAEARRVLRPGGRFLFNSWDRIAKNDFAHHVTLALGALYPDDPPLFMDRTPHGYHDTDLIRAQLGTAGFGKVEIERVEAESRAPAARDAAVAYCQGTPLRNEITARDPDGLERATDLATEWLEREFGSGPVSGAICAYVVQAAS